MERQKNNKWHSGVLDTLLIFLKDEIKETGKLWRVDVAAAEVRMVFRLLS